MICSLLLFLIRYVFFIIAAAIVINHTKPVSALSSPISQKMAEISPLRAAMLTKKWQGDMLDVEEKVGVVPELGSTSVATRRSGPELPRRALCKQQYARFYDTTYAMALADKNPPKIALAKRKVIPSLIMDGKACGPHCTTYASLTTPATMALVIKLEKEWSILALTVNPIVRKLETIIAAEKAMLEGLRLLAKDGGASIRLRVDAKETLASNTEQLCLVPPDNEDDKNAWFQC